LLDVDLVTFHQLRKQIEPLLRDVDRDVHGATLTHLVALWLERYPTPDLRCGVLSLMVAKVIKHPNDALLHETPRTEAKPH
jgi:hypothetical protein